MASRKCRLIPRKYPEFRKSKNEYGISRCAVAGILNKTQKTRWIMSSSTRRHLHSIMVKLLSQEKSQMAVNALLIIAFSIISREATSLFDARCWLVENTRSAYKRNTLPRRITNYFNPIFRIDEYQWNSCFTSTLLTCSNPMEVRRRRQVTSPRRWGVGSNWGDAPSKTHGAGFWGDSSSPQPLRILLFYWVVQESSSSQEKSEAVKSSLAMERTTFDPDSPSRQPRDM